jgi:hypothetical protein
MTVARTDGEASATIEFAGRAEVAHRMHDVVESAGQTALTSSRRTTSAPAID